LDGSQIVSEVVKKVSRGRARRKGEDEGRGGKARRKSEEQS
jgi:hypothetical protein